MPNFREGFAWARKRDNYQEEIRRRQQMQEADSARRQRRAEEQLLSVIDDQYQWNTLGNEAILAGDSRQNGAVTERSSISSGPGLRDQIVSSPSSYIDLSDLKEAPPKEVIKKNYKLNADVTHSSTSYGDSRRYSYGDATEKVAALDQVPFPNCCGICILKNISISHSLSNKNFNKFLDEIIENLKGSDHYGKIMIYTTTNETSYGYWEKYEYDDKGNKIYFEDSSGNIEDNR